MFGSIGIFDQQRNEGIDAILMRKRKACWGGRKNWSGGNRAWWKSKPEPIVAPYKAPDTMRAKRRKK